MTPDDSQFFFTSALKPLIARIEKTDWFIDQIVYRLCGLTEEEIRVVEESGGR